MKKIAEKIQANNAILDGFQVLEWFLQIFNNHTPQKAAACGKSNGEIYLDFTLNYIETNVYLPIGVKDLTNLFGVSQPYLYRLFNKGFHMSPKQYLPDYKLRQAKKMFLDTEMSVTQIANSAEYGDVLAFSKFLPQKKGCRPKNTVLPQAAENALLFLRNWGIIMA